MVYGEMQEVAFRILGPYLRHFDLFMGYLWNPGGRISFWVHC